MQSIRTKQTKTFIIQLIVTCLLTGIFSYLFIRPIFNIFIFGIYIGCIVYSSIRAYEGYLKPRLSHWNFFLVLIVNSLAYVIIMIVAVMLSLVIINDFNFHFVFQHAQEFIISQRMLYGIIFGWTLGFIFSSYSMFNTLLGKNLLLKLLIGKYRHPFEEERIFMFIDLKSSTTIAEKLGHKNYLSLLNEFFFDLAEPVNNTRGEIYKYVGDEAIISWKMKIGVKNNHCLECFFLLKNKIANNAKKYRNNYGLVPEFKAGLHGGMIVTGEMGFIKKEIAYMGDVLNTTARLEELCSKFGTELIVSDVLLSKMQNDERNEVKSLGEIKIRGKQTNLAVSSVQQKTNNF